MNKKLFRIVLKNLPLGEIRFYEQVGSTNDEALAWAAEGAPDLSLVVAEEQTAGRGRVGRKWFTPPGTALAVSLILKPTPAERRNSSLISGLGALALVDALRHYDLTAQVKWPNDILINRRKVAGVLAESVWMGTEVESFVLGMGVNVLPAAIPPGEMLNFPATCVQDEASGPVERTDLLREMLSALLAWRLLVGTETFVHAWETTLAFRGEMVRVWADETESVRGELLGLETDGSLRVRSTDGAVHLLRFGELHLRPL